jgi:hypothetical protein
MVQFIIFNFQPNTKHKQAHQTSTTYIYKKIEIKRNHASPKTFTLDFVFRIQLLTMPSNDQIPPHMQMQSQWVSSNQIVG